MTVQRYYGGFVSLFGVAASTPFIPPLLHLFIPDSSAFADYLYPPLGDFEWIGVAATIGILFVVTFVVFHYCESVTAIHRRAPAILMATMAISACALMALYVLFVRHIPVASINLDVPVSVGLHRSDLAHQTYPQLSDWEMLHTVSPDEEQIQKFWTPKSICVVRIFLWFLYTLIVSCFLAVISLAVYRHASETPGSSSPPPATP